ncbi:MAG TPA: dihydrofolate reductase family protein [Jatrophihabitans sp.]
MRTLLPVGDSAQTPDDTTDVHAHYATNWIENGGVRVNFVSSVDGSATVEGKSRGLQTPGDNQIFAALRDLADVILVGASTATKEGYQPSRPSATRQAKRAEYGLSPFPASAVMSASLNIDLSSKLYSDASPQAPTLIITSSTAPLARRNDIIDLAGGDRGLQLLEAPSVDGGGVDFAHAAAELRSLGYRRILCEGGPRLFSAGLLSRAVDELCLSITPMLTGPGSPTITAGDEWPEDFLPQLTLTGLLTEDDALFCRYRVRH